MLCCCLSKVSTEGCPVRTSKDCCILCCYATDSNSDAKYAANTRAMFEYSRRNKISLYSATDCRMFCFALVAIGYLRNSRTLRVRTSYPRRRTVVQFFCNKTRKRLIVAAVQYCRYYGVSLSLILHVQKLFVAGEDHFYSVQ